MCPDNQRTGRPSYVTTRGGDAGTAEALDGRRLPKHHPIMQCTGTADELRAQLAMARAVLADQGGDEAPRAGEAIDWLLHLCLVLGTECSDPQRAHPEYRAAPLGSSTLDRMEAAQAAFEQDLPPLRGFIVSARTPAAAQVDVACTVARRLERCVTELVAAEGDFAEPAVLPLVNRLSDFLYILARWLDRGTSIPADYQAHEW
jgi:cob(I)alamin adenosyltransferase